MSYIKKKLSRKEKLDAKSKKKARQDRGNGFSSSIGAAVNYDFSADTDYWATLRQRQQELERMRREINERAANIFHNQTLFGQSRISMSSPQVPEPGFVITYRDEAPPRADHAQDTWNYSAQQEQGSQILTASSPEVPDWATGGRAWGAAQAGLQNSYFVEESPATPTRRIATVRLQYGSNPLLAALGLSQGDREVSMVLSRPKVTKRNLPDWF